MRAHSPFHYALGRADAGLTCLVLAGLLWGTGGLTGSLLGRTAGLGALSVAAYRLTAGGALIVVFRTVTGRRWPSGQAAWTRIVTVGVLAALATGPTAVAYMLYFRGLRTAAPGTAALLALLEPLTGTILARFVLGERLSAAGIAGAVLLAVAVLLTIRTHAESGTSPSANARHGSESQEYLRGPSAGIQPKSLCFNLDSPDGQPAGADYGVTRRVEIVFDKVTITYRGAKYEIGRGRDFYAVWTIGAPREEPLDRWPETPEGWSAAWNRFARIEVPGTIAPVGRGTPPLATVGAPAAGMAGAVGTAQDMRPTQGIPATDSEPTAAEWQVPPAGAYAPGPRFAQESAPGPYPGYDRRPGTNEQPGVKQQTEVSQQAGAGRRPGFGRTMAAASGPRGGVISSGLLLAGVALGVAGLFPGYIGGSSLASTASNLVPHIIYLAGWTVAAALILLGGTRLRLGALLAAGLSLVTFGLFVADAGEAISGGAHAWGAGLILSLVGWLAAAAGSFLAFRLPPAAAADDVPAGRGFFARPRGPQVGPIVLLILAGLGVAAAFAPSWDSYTLRTSAGQSQYVTAGNAFSQPGLVITGDVLVMVALVVVIVAAAFWRPSRHGGLLLAGAIIPMAGQAISALIQVGSGVSPSQFGISSAEANQLGLTISSGVTPAFWIYCAFLVALIVSCAWMLFTPAYQGTLGSATVGPEGYGSPAGPNPYSGPVSSAADARPAGTQSHGWDVANEDEADDDDPIGMWDDDTVGPDSENSAG